MLRIQILLIILLFLIPFYSIGADINLGPLYHPVINSEYEKEFTALGPFIIYRKGSEYSEYGFRPLYHKTLKKRGNVKELEFVYPLTSYKRRENFSWFQYQFFLFVYNTETTRSGYKNKEINLFPLIFYNNEENAENNYFAFFPLYGTMKNKFAKDKIRFFFFPLYMRTEVKGEVTDSVMWPFVSTYSGKLEGGRFWPLAGTRTNNNKDSYQEFVLWPVYVKREREFYGEQFYIKSFFPVYSEAYFHGVSNKSYLWPFIQHTVNHNNGNERWDLPWPIINVTSGGTDYQKRVFPFYSKAIRNENDEDGYIMWPIYKYKNIDLASYRRSKKSILLFLYKDIREEPIVEGFRPKRNIDLWPLFSYSKDASGHKNFHIFTVFEPFIRSNDRLYRNYASFWRIFVWEKTDNVSRSSLLWNLVSSYSDEQRYIFDIRPIFPLFTYSRHDVDKSWSILGGFLGFGTKEGKNIIKFFYIPIKV